MSEAHVENNKSKLLVEAIANGTVIDHIAPGQEAVGEHGAEGGALRDAGADDFFKLLKKAILLQKIIKPLWPNG